jgi:hypothetical protein
MVRKDYLYKFKNMQFGLVRICEPSKLSKALGMNFLSFEVGSTTHFKLENEKWYY